MATRRKKSRRKTQASAKRRKTSRKASPKRRKTSRSPSAITKRGKKASAKKCACPVPLKTRPLGLLRQQRNALAKEFKRRGSSIRSQKQEAKRIAELYQGEVY